MDFEERRWLGANPFIWILPVVFGLAIAAALLDGESWAGVAVIGTVALLLVTGSMTTRVREGQLTVTYWPIWRRRIDLSAIRSARLVPYKWTHFGGWGIRYGRKAWAFTVWEKQAVRLELRGLDLVVGSLRAQELMDALRANGVMETTDEA